MNAVNRLGEEQWKIEMTYSFITPEIFAFIPLAYTYNIIYIYCIFFIAQASEVYCIYSKKFWSETAARPRNKLLDIAFLKKYQADFEKALRAFANLLHEPLEPGQTTCPGTLGFFAQSASAHRDSDVGLFRKSILRLISKDPRYSSCPSRFFWPGIVCLASIR